jgi:hypothetical protein
MQPSLTTNVLGFLTIAVFVSACTAPVEEIKVRAEPVDKPTLVLPATGELNARPVVWVVITPENIQEKWAELEAQGETLVFFALSSSGYENVSYNLNDVRSYVESQQATIVAYRSYYNAADAKLDEANNQLNRSYWSDR